MSKGSVVSRGQPGVAQASSHDGKQSQTIRPFLWFDTKAEEAAKFYVSIFPNSRIVSVERYGEAGPGTPGAVMTVEFELHGLRFIALNGGPHFRFTEAISFSINCETQQEVDKYWKALSEGGQENPCGWVKDRYALSWQVVPAVLGRLLGSADRAKANRAMQSMLTMKKLDIAALQKAFDG